MPDNLKQQYVPVIEDLLPYSSTWENDNVENSKDKTGSGRVAWWPIVKRRTGGMGKATNSILGYKAWPTIKQVIFKKKQAVAILLLAVFGILPFAIVASPNVYGNSAPALLPFFFQAKTISCGKAFGTPQNSTVSGIEALFVLDMTTGQYTFSQVKMIDVLWDIGLGRGFQLLAWWVSYNVFSDALLRTIERHPASFETFMRLCLEGPCISSIWALLKDLTRTKSKRSTALFFYMVLSSAYVLSLPTILGAMTGYISTAIAWVDAGTGGQIIPASNFVDGTIIYSAGNDTFENGICTSRDDIHFSPGNYYREQQRNCRCKIDNGTLLYYRNYLNYDISNENDLGPCIYNYTGNKETFIDLYEKRQKCSFYAVDFNNRTYEHKYCNLDSGQGYTWSEMADKTRCLPDTSNPSFKWGFSTMLTAVFLIIQFVWSLSMYILWQETQFNSKLVKAGYGMTILRAAFVIGTATRWKTGLENEDLVKADKKLLDTSLYGKKRGTWKKRKNIAEVDVHVFEGIGTSKEDQIEFELRRRDSRATVDTDYF